MNKDFAGIFINDDNDDDDDDGYFTFLFSILVAALNI
jgi:hypothetical protein